MESVTIGVQVNYKTVATLSLPVGCNEPTAVAAAMLNANVIRYIAKHDVIGVVYKMHRILNIITSEVAPTINS